MVQVPSCPLCSGRRPFCIHKSYPLQGLDVEKRVKEKLKKDFFGPSYSVFIGRHGYPNVFAGPMIGLEARKGIDSPQQWYGMDYSKIIELRSFLLRSKQKESIFSHSKFILENQELAMAEKPHDTEIYFKKTPHFSFTLSERFQPMGPSGELERMRVTENVKVRERVERVVTDDLKAAEQVFLLHKTGMGVHKISSVLSSGVLGLDKNKKLVPSRWSVTGVDDIITKKLLEKVRTYPSISDYMVFEAEHLDNHFVILLMPGSWEFENFEAWAPGSNWSSQTQSRIIEEYEPFQGRSDYAVKQSGGYYAARYPVTLYLEGIHKQARVISFREVYEGYTVPLGVFVVRNVAENAFKGKVKVFGTQQEALEYVDSRLRIPIENYKMESKILKQKRIFDYGS